MKKTLALILLTFIYGCGYTSLYNETENDIKINVLSMEGDFEINNFIKNNLKIASKKNSLNTHDIILKSKYKKIVLAKNAKGEATDYNLEMSVNFIINSSNNKKLEFKEDFKIKKNNDNFEQSNYERDFKRNFSKIVQEKLILNLNKINDN
tara:strand:- start:1044 stop:1496 length:453 start_codon:yes stop_codon:yes gene_type:complete